MRWKHIFPGIVLFVLITQVAVVKGDESLDYFVNANQLASEKKYTEAFVQYELAMQKEPGNVDIYISYGWYLFLDGNTDKAITITGKGYALDKTNRFIIGNLALYYSCCGDLSRGDQFYDSFFKLKLEKWVYCAVFQEDIIDHKNMFKRDPDYTHTLTGYVSHGMSLYPDFESACATWREMKKYENEGDDLLQKGEFAKADELYNAALPFRESVFGKDHKETADHFNLIGYMYNEGGDYDRAIVYLKKALSIRLKVTGENNEDVIASYSNLGYSYNKKSQFDEAIVYLDKALAIRITLSGENHIDTAASYNEIGFSYCSKRDFRKAEEYFEKSLGIQMKVLGENHPDTAKCMNKIGILFSENNEYDRAIAFYEKAYAIWLKLSGENNPDIAILCNNIGLAYNDKGNYSEALKYHEKALVIQVKLLGENHSDVAGSYFNIGSVCRNMAEYDKAIGYYEKSLAIRRKAFGEDHPEIVKCYTSIGVTYSDKCEYDKAIVFHEKSLAILLKASGESNLDVATIYNNIGGAYDGKGEHGKAIEFYGKSLLIRQKLLGENHLDVALCYNNIGAAFDCSGEYDKAIDSYNKSLAICVNILGENNLNVATCFNNIGCSYGNKGEYDKAIKYYEKSLAIRLAILGDHHVDVASCYNNIGTAYDRKGEYDKAIASYEKSLAICLKVLGENHFDVALCYNNFGTTYLGKGEYPKALEFFQKSLAICLKVFGKDHPIVATNYNNIANAYLNYGEFDKAIWYFEKAIAIQLKVLGENHPDSAKSYNNIGNAYQSKGEYDKAIGYYDKALVIYGKLFGENHPDMLLCYSNIGRAYDSKGEYDKAIGYFEKALAMQLNLSGSNHPDVAKIYNNIGTSYNSKGEFDKAIGYYEKALDIQLKALGGNHPDLAFSYNNIGNVYNSKNEAEKALSNFEKALAIQLKSLGGNHPNVATSYNNIGVLYQNKGEYDKAIENFGKACAIQLKVFGENHPDVMLSYSNMGLAYIGKGECDKALVYLNKALDISMKSESRQTSILVAVNLGIAYASKDNYSLSASSFEKAISVIEQARNMMGAGKTEFMARNIDAYYYLLKTRALMKDTEKVFSVAESMRSRGFLDRLTLSAALSVPGVSPEIKSKMLFLNDEIESLASRRLKEIQKSQEDQDSKLLIAISNELAAKEKEFSGFDDTLMKIDKYRDMRKPKIATLADAKALCGKDKAIVEYVIWEEDNKDKQSYALVITSSGMKIVRLDAAFDYSGTVAKYREAIIVGRTDEVPGLSSSLYAKLIAPIEQDLEGISSVIIVPDGSLAFLPFDSLRKSADAPYLCEKFSLSLQSSVSVMMMVRTRDYSKDTREAMLAFGGAVYDMNGKNTDRGNKRAGIIMRGVGFKEKKNRESQGPRGYYAAQGFSWRNIPGTKTEVQTIASNVFGDKGVTVVTGKDVTEAALKGLSAKKKLKGYHAVHLACHGYYDPEFPGYSAVVFSEVSQKDSAEDGYLSVEEAALLDMDADMVVLSACETGIGTIVRGDGVVGLTRAFNVAGANSVGVTLWTVDDNATNEFMVSVYKKMKERNISFAKAAYLTKMEFIKGKINGHDYSDPYFWSPFVVYGE